MNVNENLFDPWENFRQELQPRGHVTGRMPQDWYDWSYEWTEKQEGINTMDERGLQIKLAACLAHRSCLNEEQDPQNGKLAGFCVVCGVLWPCETAEAFIFKLPVDTARLSRNSEDEIPF